MAFNPFHWFRKHQKKLIVVVTVFVMFIFIASFGRGDVFERMTNYFGMRSQRGEVVATIDGTKYKEGEVEKIGRQRKLVTDFLLSQAAAQHEKVLKELLDKELKLDQKANPILDPNQRLRFVCTRIQNRLQTLQRSGIQIAMNDIRSDLESLESLGSDPEFSKDEDNVARLQKVSTLLGFQMWQFERQSRDDLYFGGNAKKIEDTLDFIMWKHQADKLRINLSDADLAREVNREAAGFEVFTDFDKIKLEKDKTVLEFFKRVNPLNMTEKDLVEGLRDAFRVNLAQGTYLGSAGGVRSYRSQLGPGDSPAAGTPDEFLAFYRDMRTALKVQFLAIPAEKFLDKVPDPKDDAELLARFGKFKDQEPNPFYRDPGFKEPRRILVQYLAGNSGDKVYRDKAKQAATFTVSTAKSYRDRAAPVASLIGLSSRYPVEAAVSLAALASQNPLTQEYDTYVADNGPPWLPPGPNADVEISELSRRARRIRLSSVYDGASIASAVGGGNRGPLGAVGSLALMSLLVETRSAMSQTGGVMLATGDPQNLFGIAALALAAQPKTMPYEQLERQFLIQLEERLARQFLRDQLDTIGKELNKLKKEPAKAEEFLAKTLKENPTLKLVSMSEPRSQIALTDALERKVDLKIGELFTSFQKRLLAQRDHPFFASMLKEQIAQPERTFVGNLFQGQGPYEPQNSRTMARFIEDDPAEFDRVEMLWWRKDDKSAEVRSFAAARDDVLRAWKMDYARQLARTEAEKIQREIRTGKLTPADAERLLREKQAAMKLGPIFDIDNISQLVVPPREVHMIAAREDYRAYQIPSDKAALMPYMAPPNYPAIAFVRQLLVMERPGDATVVADLPETTYYVAVLDARDEPSVRQFRGVYTDNSMPGSLYGRFTRMKAEEYRRMVIEGLRKQAGKVDKEGRFDIPESVRKRESREGDGE